MLSLCEICPYQSHKMLKLGFCEYAACRQLSMEGEEPNDETWEWIWVDHFTDWFDYAKEWEVYDDSQVP